MRTLLLSTALLAAAFALPSAQAHDMWCDFEDLPCTTQCVAHAFLPGHGCSLEAPPEPGFAPCASGETGVVLEWGVNRVPACLPSVTAASCPPGTLGVVLIVGGSPRPLCVGLE